jgi:RNA polymerase sigma-70 factor (ECF subfamily)
VPPEAAEPAAEPSPEESISVLYRQLGPLIYRRCLRLLRSREEARDATQEVFLKLVRHESRLLDRGDVVPWLYRVATNHCLNLRRNSRQRSETALDDGAEPAPLPADDRVDAILVQRLLARFDGVTQAIAVAILVDDLEHEEVAAALGISRRALARKLERFLEKSRRHLVLSGDAASSPDAR